MKKENNKSEIEDWSVLFYNWAAGYFFGSYYKDEHLWNFIWFCMEHYHLIKTGKKPIKDHYDSDFKRFINEISKTK